MDGHHHAMRIIITSATLRDLAMGRQGGRVPATAQCANLDHRHDAVIPSCKSDQDVGQTTGWTGLEGSNTSPPF